MSVFASSHCPDLTGCEDVRIDFNCQRKHILNSQASCCEEYCADSSPEPPTNRENIVDFNFFGVELRLDSNQAIAQMIFLVFNIFLGIVALAAAAIGVFAAVRRANANDDNEVQSSAKTMRNAILGFIIVGLSILIVQFISSLFGIGSINQIVNFTQFLPGDESSANL